MGGEVVRVVAAEAMAAADGAGALAMEAAVVEEVVVARVLEGGVAVAVAMEAAEGAAAVVEVALAPATAAEVVRSKRHSSELKCIQGCRSHTMPVTVESLFCSTLRHHRTTSTLRGSGYTPSSSLAQRAASMACRAEGCRPPAMKSQEKATPELARHVFVTADCAIRLDTIL